MTAFLKIENCKTCQRALPWEWIPTVLLSGRALAGTGVWRSQLIDGRCPACLAAQAKTLEDTHRERTRRGELIALLGGEKPYRDFTFERYEVATGNHLAYEHAKQFSPVTESLYLWGRCGVGKTHLAYASARRCFNETLSVSIVRPSELSRKLRMQDPERQQAALDGFIAADVLVLDDLGSGIDTPYTRQILQEILDRREFQDRAGLIITSQYSLSALAMKMQEDAIPSRLAGVCFVIEVKGTDHRVKGMAAIPRRGSA